MILLDLAIPVFTGLVNRFRGGWIPTGHTQLARGIYSVLMAAVIWALTLNPLMSLITIPLWFLGSLASNSWMGITSIQEFFEGAASGWFNVFFVAMVLLYFHYDFGFLTLTIAGLSKGLCYLIAKYIPNPNINQFHSGPELGEVLFGIALGVGLVVGLSS